MCTSLALKTKDFYFGRNLDLECQFGERVVITPRNYPFFFRKAGVMLSHYAMIGMASVENGYPLYAEAANEKGLCMAGLNFPGNAFYSECPETEAEAKKSISPFELIPWILGSCSSVEETKEILNTISITSIPFSDSIPLSPLHWHIADSRQSVTLEAVRDGMKIYDNPVGVLTNNPSFDFHLTNLNQYLNLTAAFPANRFGELSLRPFGQGFGAIGLPGDTSPASRFVRASFYKINSVCEPDEESSVTQFFHLLDSVAIVRGSVITPQENYELTTYSCCINASLGIFYYKTYENSRISAVRLYSEDLDQKKLIEFPLKTRQDFWMHN